MPIQYPNKPTNKSLGIRARERSIPRRIDVFIPKMHIPKVSRKDYVLELEQKLLIDMEREFSGQSSEQRTALLTIIDRNADLRREARLPPGVYEKLDYPKAETTADSLKRSNANIDEIKQPLEPHMSIFTGQISGMAQLMADSSGDLKSDIEDDTDTFYQSEYPVLEHILVGDAKEEKLKAIPKTVAPLTEYQVLRKKYAKFISRDLPVSSNGDDMEASALREMKKVSSDLQHWVKNTLDNSILLDPEIVAQVQELDLKSAHQIPTKPPIESVDITGFNVLLNACKPAMLEARPPIKLNVVKDANRNSKSENIPKKPVVRNPHKDKGKKSFNLVLVAQLQKRLNFGAWYLDCEKWTGHEKKAKTTTDSHVFGGIVQQKLDEIARKRSIEMEAFLKEVKDAEKLKKTAQKQ